MSWQSGSINPATTSPLADISRIKNDLSVLKGVLGGTQDADVPFTPYAFLVTSASGGLGYGIGAGGTVTQSTSKSTAVTLNKPCGQITMNNAALAAGAEVFFTVNNTMLNDSSTTVLISPLWSTVSPLNYQCRITYVGANTLGIAVKNISAGSLSEALVINFAIIKGSAS